MDSVSGFTIPLKKTELATAGRVTLGLLDSDLK
jgi:hypothetical protein